MQTYLVNGVEMTAQELIDCAERKFGCQTREFVKLTSVAAQVLRERGVSVIGPLLKQRKENET